MRLARSALGPAALVAVAFFLPYLLPPFYVSILREILIFAIFALSIEILLGSVGLPTLGQAGISGTASYVVAVLMVKYGAGAGVAALAGIIGATLIALVFGALSVRTRGTYFLLITLAEGMIVWGLAIRWTTMTGGQSGLPGIARPAWLRPYWAYYWFVLGVLVVVFLAVRQLRRSPFGLTLRGIRESETRMRTLGYHVTLHRLAAFVLSGVIAGIAGVLFVFDKAFVSPRASDLARSAEGLLMVILGGPGTLSGSLVGAGFVVGVRNVVSIWTDRWPLLMGLGFVLVVLFAPNGVVPAMRRRGGPTRDWTAALETDREATATTTSQDEELIG